MFPRIDKRAMKCHVYFSRAWIAAEEPKEKILHFVCKILGPFVMLFFETSHQPVIKMVNPDEAHSFLRNDEKSMMFRCTM